MPRITSSTVLTFWLWLLISCTLRWMEVSDSDSWLTELLVRDTASVAFSVAALASLAASTLVLALPATSASEEDSSVVEEASISVSESCELERCAVRLIISANFADLPVTSSLVSST